MVYGKLFNITQKESRKIGVAGRTNTKTINTSQVLHKQSLAINKWLMILIDKLQPQISKAT
jgi:hypothetical protein